MPGGFTSGGRDGYQNLDDNDPPPPNSRPAASAPTHVPVSQPPPKPATYQSSVWFICSKFVFRLFVSLSGAFNLNCNTSSCWCIGWGSSEPDPLAAECNAQSEFNVIQRPVPCLMPITWCHWHWASAHCGCATASMYCIKSSRSVCLGRFPVPALSRLTWRDTLICKHCKQCWGSWHWTSRLQNFWDSCSSVGIYSSQALPTYQDRSTRR